MKLGIDVGGTRTKIAVLDDKNQVVETQSRSTVIQEKPFLDFLSGIIQEKLERWPLIGQVGIGIPGAVDTHSGVVISCPALQVENLELCRQLEQRVHIPVLVENDVNAWALAEGVIGSCKEDKDYVLVTIGTGIGAGIVINGEIYRGANFEAGEIGYMVAREDLATPRPTKQEFGSFERRASAIAVSRRYEELTGQKEDTREIFRRVQQQEDPVAAKIVSGQIDILSIGLANIACILQPAKIVIGGGLANEGEYLLSQLRDRLSRLLPTEPTIVLSGGGNWGGAIGAAMLMAPYKSSLTADSAD